jgi:hypothetical protein
MWLGKRVLRIVMPVAPSLLHCNNNIFGSLNRMMKSRLCCRLDDGELILVRGKLFNSSDQANQVMPCFSTLCSQNTTMAKSSSSQHT